MTLTELNEYLHINSLQYFVGDDIEVTDVILKGLVTRGINTYGVYRPRFTESYTRINAYSQVLSAIDGRTILNVSNIYYTQPIMGTIESKAQFRWEWSPDTKILRTQVSGNFYLQTLCLPTLEDIGFESIEFLDLMQGLYMMYIGESRKSFNLGDLPFSNDGQDIYNDGKELFDITLENLKTVNSNWYEAIN